MRRNNPKNATKPMTTRNFVAINQVKFIFNLIQKCFWSITWMIKTKLGTLVMSDVKSKMSRKCYNFNATIVLGKPYFELNNLYLMYHNTFWLWKFVLLWPLFFLCIFIYLTHIFVHSNTFQSKMTYCNSVFIMRASEFLSSRFSTKNMSGSSIFT